jgi:hypothetical protein
MKVSRFLIASLCCLIAVGSFAADDEQKKQQDRTEIQQMAQDTLNRLYKAEPSAQAAVQKGYGYAVFQQHGHQDSSGRFRQR